MPGVSGATVVTTLVCSLSFRTRGCGCAWAPGIPHALFFWGGTIKAQLGRNAVAGSRRCECYSIVIARSESDGAIRPSALPDDCFARRRRRTGFFAADNDGGLSLALAMTVCTGMPLAFSLSPLWGAGGNNELLNLRIPLTRCSLNPLPQGERERALRDASAASIPSPRAIRQHPATGCRGVRDERIRNDLFWRCRHRRG